MKKFTIQKGTETIGGWWVMRAGEYFDWYPNVAAAQRALEVMQPSIERTIKVSGTGWLCVKSPEGGWSTVFKCTPKQIEEWKTYHGE